MFSRKRLSVCACFASVILACAGPTIADEPGGHWCRTFERWASRNPQPEGSDCPLEGVCDDPAVRDTWIPKPGASFRVLRVRFNVFAEDDGSNPAASKEDLAQQIVSLNQQFLPSGIQFLTEIEYINDSTYRFYNNDEIGMKSKYADDPEHKLNVFIVRTSGFSVGTFPWDSDALTFLGGVILHEFHLGPTGTTLAHEIGHNVGLWHTHHGVSEVQSCSACYERADGLNGDTTGDFARDTPPTPRNFTCSDPGTVDGCSGTPWGDTNLSNYMSYAPQVCQNHFTPQQGGRLNCWVDDVLSGWICEECAPTGACCTFADSDFSCTDVQSGNCAGEFFGAGTACDDLPNDRCDCNGNNVADLLDIADLSESDCNGNVVPDSCESDEDCNGNGSQDICELANGGGLDCNGNGLLDECDIADLTSDDCNGNGVPDDCERDCNGNGVADECDIVEGDSPDEDANSVPDECQKNLYVAAIASGANDGSSWEDAITDLQDALSASFTGDRILIAQGVYLPSELVLRSSTFAIPAGVQLYGGFAGPGAPVPDARRVAEFQTILSGDLAGNDESEFSNRADNVYNVVTCVNNGDTVVIDGLTIRGGNANGSTLPRDAGGAIRIANASPTIRNCVIEDSSAFFGGGAECFNGGDAKFVDCRFLGNRSMFRGGGLHVNSSSPSAEGCDFVGNSAGNSGGGARFTGSPNASLSRCRFLGNDAQFGGGLVFDNTTGTLDNCLFSGNSAEETSGAMHNWFSFPTINQCAFVSNSAGLEGGGLYNLTSSVATLNGCILWNNRDQNGTSASSQIALQDTAGDPVVSYSMVQGGWLGGIGNISGDPLFLDPDGPDNVYGTSDDSAGLFKRSPCINAGDPGTIFAGADLGGRARIMCGLVDMGPEEFGQGDFECGGHVDIDDYPSLSGCFSGSLPGDVSSECQVFDTDADADIDLIDFGRFQSVFLGTCSTVVSESPLAMEICSDEGLTLEASASGVDLFYEWRRDGDVVVGATESSYVVGSAGAVDSGTYCAVVRSACGDVDFSEPAVVTVNAAPTEVSLQPQPASPCVGGSIFLTGSASNSPDYQWYKNGEPIPDATGLFVFVSDVTLEDSGDYHFTAENSCNVAESGVATITVMDCASP